MLEINSILLINWFKLNCQIIIQLILSGDASSILETDVGDILNPIRGHSDVGDIMMTEIRRLLLSPSGTTKHRTIMFTIFWKFKLTILEFWQIIKYLKVRMFANFVNFRCSNIRLFAADRMFVEKMLNVRWPLVTTIRHQ